MFLKASDICLSYGARTVLNGLSVTLNPGEITVIIGPNGSGKSTLLSVLAGLKKPDRGSVKLKNKPLHAWRRKDLARQVSFLPQMPQAPGDILVRDLVAHGRFAHRRALAQLTKEDHAMIERALLQTGTDRFADRPFFALSGGERQRVWIALGLAQMPRMMLLDEPTSFLDLGYQFQILSLLRQINRSGGPGLVMVLHDFNQACAFADRILLINRGSLIAEGSPDEVVNAEAMSELFGVRLRLVQPEGLSYALCVPEGIDQDC